MTNLSLMAFGIALFTMFFGLMLYVVFGQITVRKLRKKP